MVWNWKRIIDHRDWDTGKIGLWKGLDQANVELEEGLEYGKDANTVGFGLGDFRAREKIVQGKDIDQGKIKDGGREGIGMGKDQTLRVGEKTMGYQDVP